MVLLRFLQIPPVHINRDILECKVFNQTCRVRVSFILIETYWNVKVRRLLYKVHSEEILIETYWNVKVFEPPTAIFI